MTSLTDRFGATAAKLFDQFGAVPVTVIRKVTAPRSNADRAAGIVDPTPVTLTGRGILGSRKVRADDGTIRQEAVMRLDVETQPGDKITIGTRTLHVDSVTEINPDGTTAIIYVAVVR